MFFHAFAFIVLCTEVGELGTKPAPVASNVDSRSVVPIEPSLRSFGMYAGGSATVMAEGLEKDARQRMMFLGESLMRTNDVEEFKQMFRDMKRSIRDSGGTSRYADIFANDMLLRDNVNSVDMALDIVPKSKRKRIKEVVTQLYLSAGMIEAAILLNGIDPSEEQHLKICDLWVERVKPAMVQPSRKELFDIGKVYLRKRLSGIDIESTAGELVDYKLPARGGDVIDSFCPFQNVPFRLIRNSAIREHMKLSPKQAAELSVLKTPTNREATHAAMHAGERGLKLTTDMYDKMMADILGVIGEEKMQRLNQISFQHYVGECRSNWAAHYAGLKPIDYMENDEFPVNAFHHDVRDLGKTKRMDACISCLVDVFGRKVTKSMCGKIVLLADSTDSIMGMRSSKAVKVRRARRTTELNALLSGPGRQKSARLRDR